MNLSSRDIRFRAFFLLSLFLLMGITLGVHALSQDHANHILRLTTQNGDHSGGADRSVLLSDDFCAIDAFVHNSFDSTHHTIIIGTPLPYLERVYELPQIALEGDVAYSFGLRAPPISSVLA